MNIFITTIKNTLIFILVLMVNNTLASEQNYRLSKSVQPITQHITLDLDPEKTSYTGTTFIDLNVKSDVDSIGLYWLGINVQSIKLKSKKGERELSAHDDEYHIHRLSDGKKITKGQYQLTLRFSADFSTDALGLYRTKYK